MEPVIEVEVPSYEAIPAGLTGRLREKVVLSMEAFELGRYGGCEGSAHEQRKFILRPECRKILQWQGFDISAAQISATLRLRQCRDGDETNASEAVTFMIFTYSVKGQ